MTDGRFDIVGWDPRGSGGSAPVSCFADPGEPASFWNGACRSRPSGPRSAATWPGRSRSPSAAALAVLERLRQGPIPAPPATPPGELTHGEALTLLEFAVLPTPAIWPQAAALLEQAAEGDASATGRHLVDLTIPARGTVCPSDRLPFDPDFGARRSS